MARLSDLKFTYWLYMKGYRHRSHEWRPGACLRKPLSEARIALITTAAFHLPDQPPFNETVRGGDYSYREIPAASDARQLRIAHRSDAFDDAGLRADPNLALPLERLDELAREGIIGEVSPRHFSFMGSIPAPSRLVKTTAPEVAARLLDDKADAVLLTPV
ncbi:MAG: hypothetical protein KIT09_35325 [Bryobacteraceae bacterium]|nr:hypothetical protein [Bryobacteraceae bacterium]